MTGFYVVTFTIIVFAQAKNFAVHPDNFLLAVASPVCPSGIPMTFWICGPRKPFVLIDPFIIHCINNGV